MIRYSISKLEQFSGIKAHTIRVWEQRYDILEPNRTKTNIRYYNDVQMTKLLNIVSLLHNGFRISKACELSEAAMEKEVSSILKKSSKKEGVFQAIINQLIVTGLTWDLNGFETIFTKAKTLYNDEELVMKVIHPLLLRIDLFSPQHKKNSITQPFLVNLIQQKLMAAIDRLPLPANEEERWLLFLPPDEYHDLGLLYASFMLKKYGRSVLYLGSNIPTKHLKVVAKNYGPTHAFFCMTKNKNISISQKHVDAIQSALPDCELVISGNTSILDRLVYEERVVRLDDPFAFQDMFQGNINGQDVPLQVAR